VSVSTALEWVFKRFSGGGPSSLFDDDLADRGRINL
jgi:hypothetical protein